MGQSLLPLDSAESPGIRISTMLRAKRLVAIEGGANPRAEVQQQHSDQQVIEGLAAGQSWAAGIFYDRVSVVVERTLRRILQSSDADYEDLEQITLERVVQSLVERRFSGACSLTTWASAIAGHVGVDALRSRVRERRLFRDDHEPAAQLTNGFDASNLERRLEARSDITQVQQILATMKAEHAETLVLHDALGHELSEIAVLMGVSVAAAQSRLIRGRKELLRRAKHQLGRK
jgi:RNA polymerase sigma-70 factor (ECF subfamily)